MSRALASTIDGVLSRASSSSGQLQGRTQMQRRSLHSTVWRRRSCRLVKEADGTALQTRQYAATAMMSRRPEMPRDSEVFMDDDSYDRESSSSARREARTSSSSRELGPGSSSLSSASASLSFSPNSNARAAGTDSVTLSYMRKRSKGDSDALRMYLRETFPHLDFPENLARQMLTHISAKEAWAGHNARLAFIGRRAMNAYIVLFLQSAVQDLVKSGRGTETSYDLDKIAYKTFHTHHMGEFVGNKWNLFDSMLWTPLPPSGRQRRAGSGAVETWQSQGQGEDAETKNSGINLVPKSPGLYKVAGTTVEGIFGGIFHQFGGAVAQQVFHTRLLPHLLCPNTPFGLHDAFHPAVLEMSERMGGPDSLLVSGEASGQQSDQTQRIGL